MFQLVIEAGYEDYLKENYANYRSRLEDLEQLAVFARQFATVDDFLTQLALADQSWRPKTNSPPPPTTSSFGSRRFTRPKVWSSTWCS